MPQNLYPDTNAYAILGYVVVFVILTGMIAYLVLKARNLRAELAMLETMAKEENAMTAAKNKNNGTVDTPDAAGVVNPARGTLSHRVH